jgi:hypothetical protein
MFHHICPFLTRLIEKRKETYNLMDVPFFPTRQRGNETGEESPPLTLSLFFCISFYRKVISYTAKSALDHGAAPPHIVYRVNIAEEKAESKKTFYLTG